MPRRVVISAGLPGFAAPSSHRKAVYAFGLNDYAGWVTRRYVRVRELLEAELGDEIVALDVDGGQCFGFNSVAAEIWRLLELPRDIEELQRILMARYRVGAAQCLEDLEDCLAELEERGLIRTTNTGA